MAIGDGETIARSYVELLPRAQSFGRDTAQQIRQSMAGVTGRIRSANQQWVDQTARASRQATDHVSRQSRTAADQTIQHARRAQQGQQRAVRQTADETVRQSRRSTERVSRDASRVTAGVSRSFGQMRVGIFRSFSGLGGVVAGALGAAAVGSFLKSTITSASNLNETISKTGVIFGQEALPGLRAFAKQAAQTMGQSQQQALDAAATFGIFGKSAGLTGPALTQFSTRLVTLTSDMASFSNTTPEEAITAVGAALRGESEPIRRYGVLIDDASTRQAALRLGLIKTTKEALTPQQRVLAVQQLIYQQTAAAQGDFARTSGGLANQQRILAAQFENTKAKLGEVFLPVAIRFVGFLNTTAIPAFQEFVGGVTAFGAAFKAADGDVTSSGFPGFMERLGYQTRLAFDYFQTNVMPILRMFAGYVINTVVPAIKSLAVWLSQNREVLEGLVIGITAGLAVYQAITIATRAWAIAQGLLNLVLLANPVGAVVIAVAALAAGLYIAYQRSETFRQAVQNVWNWIQTVAIPTAQRLWTEVQQRLGPAVSGLATDVRQDLLPALENLWDMIDAFLLPILRELGGFLARQQFTAAFVVTLTTVRITIETLGLTVRGLQFTINRVIPIMIRTFNMFVGAAINGAAKAFGWVPGVGPKLRDAAVKFNGFQKNVNKELAAIRDQSVVITPSLKPYTPAQARQAGLHASAFARGAFATGGAVTRAAYAYGGKVWGPGTETSDSIPAMLSRGEHVWTAREVRMAGGHRAVEEMRDAVRHRLLPVPGHRAGGAVRGYAAGGAADFNVQGRFPSPNGINRWTGPLATGARYMTVPTAQAIADGLAQSMGVAAGPAAGGPGIRGGRRGAYGGVKPWVAAVGDHIRRLFGVRDIGGVGGRPGPSDHPSGHALDFMVYNNRALGNRIASYMHTMRNRLYLTYLIWYKRIASASRGWTWRPYTRYGPGSGPTLQHMDHIHASFRRNVAGFAAGGKGPAHLAKGAWKVLQNQLAVVHQGEMVVPSDEAEELRRLFGASRPGRGYRTPPVPRGNGDGYTRLHPDDIARLADAVSERPTELDGYRLDKGISNEAARRYR